MTSKFTMLGLFVISLGISCAGHDDHDKDQMPLDYVRFPYQAMYPGDGSGLLLLSSQRNRMFDDALASLL